MKDLAEFEYYDIWEWKGRLHQSDNFTKKDTYRLSPDYEPKMEIIEHEISEQNKELGFLDIDNEWHGLDLAVRKPNFIGFKFEDGTVHFTSIWHTCPRDVPSTDILSGKVKILHATHVLFRGKK